MNRFLLTLGLLISVVAAGQTYLYLAYGFQLIALLAAIFAWLFTAMALVGARIIELQDRENYPMTHKRNGWR